MNDVQGECEESFISGLVYGGEELRFSKNTSQLNTTIKSRVVFVSPFFSFTLNHWWLVFDDSPRSLRGTVINKINPFK